MLSLFFGLEKVDVHQITLSFIIRNVILAGRESILDMIFDPSLSTCQNKSILRENDLGLFLSFFRSGSNRWWS